MAAQSHSESRSRVLRRYADLFEDETDPQVRRALLDAHILQTEAKHFKNLHLQESRLHRQYQQNAKELKELQAERHEEQEAEEAENQLPTQVNGFEFATQLVLGSNPQSSSVCKRTILSNATSIQTQTTIG